MRYALLVLLLLTSGCGQGLAWPSANSNAPVAYAQPLATPRLQGPPTPTAGANPVRVAAVPTARPSAMPTPLPPTALPSTAPAAPPMLGGTPAPRLTGELAMRTYSLDFYRTKGSIDAATIQAMALAVEQTVITSSLEIGGFLTGRVSIRFEPPQTGPCAIRGLTLSNERTIRLFYAPDTDPNRVLAILAHELFHQLQHDYYGEKAHRRADIILLEGMAVWGSRAYFRSADGRPLYQQRAQQALREGSLLPLTTSLEADCRTTTRNNIYNQWASFVEYLLSSYGRERFDTLYRDSTGRPAGSANYQGIYGKSLATLEAEWIAWLAKQP